MSIFLGLQIIAFVIWIAGAVRAFVKDRNELMLVSLVAVLILGLLHRLFG